MKLYTTDQVIDIFEKYGNMSAINARNIIDLSESIELPSDEEIDAYVKSTGYYGHCTPEYHEAIEEGAKWMRDKIKGGGE